MSNRVDELIDEPIEENGYDKEDVLGDEGLVSQLTKRVMQRALNAELRAHLGCEHSDPSGDNSGNSRNATTPKTVHAEYGSVDVAIPRDRNATFEPQLVGSGQTRLEGLADRVLGMDAAGMTVGDIRDQLAELYGVDRRLANFRRARQRPS